MEAELKAIVSARLFSLVDSYTPWSVCFSHVALVGNTKEREKKTVVVAVAVVLEVECQVRIGLRCSLYHDMNCWTCFEIDGCRVEDVMQGHEEIANHGRCMCDEGDNTMTEPVGRWDWSNQLVGTGVVEMCYSVPGYVWRWRTWAGERKCSER
jgi:hypothetical protein